MQIKNLLNLPATYFCMLRDVKRQKAFVKRVLESDISIAMDNDDGTLDEEDFKKIRGYYGFGVPAIVGEGFCTLRGKKMSTTERLVSTYQGALTGLYDDFFDKTSLEYAEIREMMSSPNTYKATSSLEKLFIHFLSRVHDNLHNAEVFDHYFNEVFSAQLESKKQLDANIETAEIKEITFNKGGYSLLFYRSVFEHDFSKGEKEALFCIGGLMQLGNDIFDVYKDEKASIRTLPTSCSKIDDVRMIFTTQLSKSIDLIRNTDYRQQDIARYINKLVLGISRCYVCLDQLEKLQEKTGGRFTPSAYSREDLVCDMEKPGNIFRSIRYFSAYRF